MFYICSEYLLKRPPSCSFCRAVPAGSRTRAATQPGRSPRFRRIGRIRNFLSQVAYNPLKRLESDEGIQENPSPISLVRLGLAWAGLEECDLLAPNGFGQPRVSAGVKQRPRLAVTGSALGGTADKISPSLPLYDEPAPASAKLVLARPSSRRGSAAIGLVMSQPWPVGRRGRRHGCAHRSTGSLGRRRARAGHSPAHSPSSRPSEPYARSARPAAPSFHASGSR
jgi:hypothetical protein